MDAIYLSETYLVCPIPIDDCNLQIPGLSYVKADHPSNTKRGGVLILYKKFSFDKTN